MVSSTSYHHHHYHHHHHHHCHHHHYCSHYIQSDLFHWLALLLKTLLSVWHNVRCRSWFTVGQRFLQRSKSRIAGSSLCHRYSVKTKSIRSGKVKLGSRSICKWVTQAEVDWMVFRVEVPSEVRGRCWLKTDYRKSFL